MQELVRVDEQVLILDGTCFGLARVYAFTRIYIFSNRYMHTYTRVFNKKNQSSGLNWDINLNVKVAFNINVNC